MPVPGTTRQPLKARERAFYPQQKRIDPLSLILRQRCQSLSGAGQRLFVGLGRPAQTIQAVLDRSETDMRRYLLPFRRNQRPSRIVGRDKDTVLQIEVLLLDLIALFLPQLLHL